VKSGHHTEGEKSEITWKNIEDKIQKLLSQPVYLDAEIILANSSINNQVKYASERRLLRIIPVSWWMNEKTLTSILLIEID